jgi:hypothetical protein
MLAASPGEEKQPSWAILSPAREFMLSREDEVIEGTGEIGVTASHLEITALFVSFWIDTNFRLKDTILRRLRLRAAREEKGPDFSNPAAPARAKDGPR